jgi:hypothetical protein
MGVDSCSARTILMGALDSMFLRLDAIKLLITCHPMLNYLPEVT